MVEQIAAGTGDRIGSVVTAFETLVACSWPDEDIVAAVARAKKSATNLDSCVSLLAAFDVAYSRYPSAMFWWKTERSEFLGFCPRFAHASGVPALELLGKVDSDGAVVWSRQGPLYMRDDREVLRSRVPKLDIVERQDRADGTVWLRTSKVPYVGPAGSGTVGGLDTISARHAHRLARSRR